MKLFYTALLIALKHSGRRLLCLLCILSVCGFAVYAAVSAQTGPPPSKAEIAIVNQDQNPLMQLVLRSADSMSGNLSGLAQLRFVSQEEAERGGYAAVVTLPSGFLDSVLDGGNLSPTVALNLQTPLEALWARQLANAGARWLTAAQLGVYAARDAALRADSLTPEQTGYLLTEMNLELFRAFSTRLSQIETRMLSASGGLPLPQYYMAALTALLTFCYSFLYQPAICALRRTSASLRRGDWSLFGAAAAHTLLLALIPSLVFAAFGGYSVQAFAACALFAALSGWFALVLALLLPSPAPCAAASILLGAGMGLCSGCLLPLPLMPPVFERFAVFLPVGQGRALLGSVLGGPFQAAGPALTAGFLLLAAALLWRFGKGDRV